MKIIIGKDKNDMGRLAADDAAAKICAAIAANGEARVIFASAASQFEFIEALLTHKEIDWSKVCGFHLDEYVGLKADHPASFRRFLKERLLAKLPCAVKSFTFVGGDAPDTAAECARLETALREKPIDLACIGIGENGHIAFNDPPVADFNDSKWVKPVKLDDVCRQQQVNDGCFATFEDVPEYAMSLTCPTLMRATWKFCIVPAPTKAEAVMRTLTWDINEKCPATILRRSDNAILYLEPASAAKL